MAVDLETTVSALKNWCDRRGVQAGVREFLQLLNRQDRLYLLPVIRERLTQDAAELQHDNLTHVTAGQELTDNQRKQLQALSGKQEVEVVVEDDRIGGVDIETDGRQVRGSVASQLANLQSTLT